MTVETTLGLERARRCFWDVVVIGAGPAGSFAARELAGRGLSVLVVDKASFPRPKVCGSCLNLRALATLAAAGLEELASRLGAVPLKRLMLRAGGRQACLPLPGGVALSRARLDAGLVESAVQGGAAFLSGVRVKLGACLDTHRQIWLCQGGRETAANARLVLAANGLGGDPLKCGTPRPTLFSGRRGEGGGSRLGAGVLVEAAPPFYVSGTIFMGCGSAGYVGLVRLEDGCLDVAAALDPARVKEAGGLGHAAAGILAEAGWPPIPRLAELPWRGTPLLTRRAARLAAARLFVLGDAAGYVEPFTGEGIAWALASGAALAPLAARACCRWQPSMPRQWAALYRRTVARRQRLCRAVAGALRHPWLTKGMLVLLGRLPTLAGPVVRYLNT